MESSLSYSLEKSRENWLLETTVTSGGVRLQPTRDAIQVFLSEATKLNALALSRALEVKLQSHMWQLKNNGLPKWIGITREEASFLIWGYHRCAVCRHS
ncbi:protein MODIFIED TRANSPORT TO THE VACUOLE 1-like [Helianthus annuus]|uniref:protein MODIFIED TRANSPORT TO THE VACUOLE 1-like n=1 Tax=Helianthus annuus TaxID=4232 RepID=UPI001652CC81|nr:protein MODIFIED TRANSPORT TO THE VACUOLE 1-like [Helianthus annuus]